MRLRRSSFAHVLPMGAERSLVVHALKDVRLVVDRDVAAILAFFEDFEELPQAYPRLAARVSGDLDATLGAVEGLLGRGLLTLCDPAAELEAASADLAATYGRDPQAFLARGARADKEGGEAYWAAGPARGISDLAAGGARIDLVLLADCDLQMEAEFIRAAGTRRGLDVRVASSFPDDVRLAAERPHDAVLVGALRSRHQLLAPAAPDGSPPYGVYVSEAHRVIEALRGVTQAPILIDNLPEPTVEPMGLAERGLNGHRNRFRLANAALSELARGFVDVHVVDVAAAIAARGAERLLDDGYCGFTHFGSPGWLLQRPQSERRAVHGEFPDLGPLASLVGGDPYVRETVLSETHLDAVVAVLGHDQKKCVILDLDGVLWPGVLAETGSPFAWSPEISGGYSFIGHYFGLHEALLCLKKRGVLLACVSKNDAEVVRRLWTYGDAYPRERLLTPDDFVLLKVNWRDKVENILEICEELGFSPESFLFIDDHPVERDRVRSRLPAVEVWGEDLLGLRRRLLEDPRLQRPILTKEAEGRTDLVKGALERARARAAGEAEYRASLGLEQIFRRAATAAERTRICELFARTTQFNATGRRFSEGELSRLAERGRVYALDVKDRFGDHGLVGAVVVSDGEILNLALSCRVLGLGVEGALLEGALADLAGDHVEVTGRIVATDRNLPVRNVFRDAGFSEEGGGRWRIRLGAGGASAPRAP